GPGAPGKAPARHRSTRTTSDGITVRVYRVYPPAPAAAPATGTPPSTITPTDRPAAGFACRGVVKGSSGKPGPGAPEAGVAASSDAPAPPSTAPGGTPPPCPPIPPECKSAPFAMAELSNDAAVGQGRLPLN